LKTKVLISLSVLAFFDMVIPVPFTSILLIYVVADKPDWFKNLVSDIYS
jgi:hypothetical protein